MKSIECFAGEAMHLFNYKWSLAIGLMMLAGFVLSPVYGQQPCDAVPGQIIVTLVNPSDRNAVAVQYGLESQPIDQVGNPPSFRMRLAAGNTQTPCQVRASMQVDARVARVEVNRKLSAMERTGLPWTLGHSWAVGNSWAVGGSVKGFMRQWFPWTIRLPEAHEINRGTRTDNGRPVKVAVLDTGIDPDHPQFAGRLVAGYDFVANDNDPREEGISRFDQAYGHGTHVAGIIALTAPEAQIMPIRVLDKDGVGELWRIVAAMIWAANNGADVINISFGYNSDPELLKNLLHNCDVPPPGTQLFPELNGNRLVIISAAGNGGNGDRIYPAGNRIDPQLGVGASTRMENLAIFSTMSVGSTGGDRFIRAVAPGENIVSTLPGGRYGLWTGTSMAAPVAAGVAALVKAQNPTLDPHSVVERLIDTGIKWECDHPSRGQIRTSRVDAFCALTNNPLCGSNPQACSP